MTQAVKNSNALWLPPPDLKISDWADEFRRIPSEASAEPGIWRTSRAEYQREIMNAASDFLTERVVVMSAAQIGKTEIILNIIGYFIDKEPSPILLLNPTLAMSQAFSKDRLAPMIRDTPCLAEKIQNPRVRDSGNTLLHKKFVGGHITMSGANSPASLASRPIRVLLCDEVDRYPVSAGEEGDPLSLAMKRTQNFWNRRIIWVSTPTLMETSRIKTAYELGTQEEWHVPCPSCGALNPFSWDRIIYKEVTEPVMKCVKCGKLFNQHEWKAMQTKGCWIAANKAANKIRSFHLNSFASPWATWEELTAQYEEALKSGEEALKVFWNTVLGLPYEAQDGIIEVGSIASHREEYKAELPEGVLVLTCGVDTQDNRLELEVVGWGMNKESWGIDYRVIYGDPGQPEVWQKLSDYLSQLWSYADGEQLGISCVCVDSGGHHTDDVYKFCKQNQRRNIFAIVGRGGQGKPSVNKPTRNNRAKVILFTLGVDTIKGDLYSRLKIAKPGAGYCHFPYEPKNNNRGYDDNYFKGLLSERMVIKRVRGRDVAVWEVRSRDLRNEPLDTRVYATGALEILNPNFEKHLKRRLKQINKPREKVEMPAVEAKDPEPKPVKKVRKQSVKVLSRGIRL